MRPETSKNPLRVERTLCAMPFVAFRKTRFAYGGALLVSC